MSTARDVAVMRRIIRRSEHVEVTHESSLEVAVQIARGDGTCPLPRTDVGNHAVFQLLAAGWLRFWPPGNPICLRLDPQLLDMFLDEVQR